MFPVKQENLFRAAILCPKNYALALSKIEQTQSLNLENKLQKYAHVAVISIHLKVVRIITHM